MVWRTFRRAVVRLGISGLGIGGASYMYMESKWSHYGTHEPRDAFLQGHINSHYAATVKENPPVCKELGSDDTLQVDVCVIGAGFAGLHTARELVDADPTGRRRVAVVDRGRVGSGASGRNGGMVLDGWEMPNDELTPWIANPSADSRALELLRVPPEQRPGSEDGGKTDHRSVSVRIVADSIAEGYDVLKGLIKKYGIQCEAQEQGFLSLLSPSYPDDDGDEGTLAIVSAAARNLIWGDESSDEANPPPLTADQLQEVVEEAKEYLTENIDTYGDDSYSYLTPDELRKRGYFTTPRFNAGAYYKKAAMAVNPLGLTFGLARILQHDKKYKNKVTIYENSELCAVREGTDGKWVLHAKNGATIIAKDVVLCTAGVPSWYSWKLSGSICRGTTSIVVTKPMPRKLLDSVAQPEGVDVVDERVCVGYFRRVPGDRLLWGGLFRATPYDEAEARTALIADIEKTFPQLKGHVDVEHQWQGDIHQSFPPFPVVRMVRETQTADPHFTPFYVKDEKSHAMASGYDLTNERAILRAGGTGKLWVNAGYSGHGIVPTVMGSRLIAHAVMRNRTMTKKDVTLLDADKMERGIDVEAGKNVSKTEQAEKDRRTVLDERYRLWSTVELLPAGGPWGQLGLAGFCFLGHMRDVHLKKY